MSGCEVDEGERSRYINMHVLNLNTGFLPVKTSSFDHTNIWTATRLDDPVCCFGSGAPPPIHPPDVIHVMNAPRPSPFFASRVYCERNGEGLE